VRSTTFLFHHFVHFYSNFWGFSRLNRVVVKHFRAGRRRAAPCLRRTCLSVRAPRAPSHGHLAPSQRAASRDASCPALSCTCRAMDRWSVHRSSGHSHPEALPSVHRSQAGTHVAYKEASAPLPRAEPPPAPVLRPRPPSEAATAKPMSQTDRDQALHTSLARTL
jgi:hypothetical protein